VCKRLHIRPEEAHARSLSTLYFLSVACLASIAISRCSVRVLFVLQSKDTEDVDRRHQRLGQKAHCTYPISRPRPQLHTAADGRAIESLTPGLCRALQVCDNGTGFVKCGLAGDNFPAHMFPSMIGKPLMRYEEEFKNVELKEVMVGDECAKHRAMLETRSVHALLHPVLLYALRCSRAHTPSPPLSSPPPSCLPLDSATRLRTVLCATGRV
jgi:hypothetical protein